MSYEEERMMRQREELRFWAKITAGVVVFLMAFLLGWPMYRVWQRELSGRAALQEATWDRQIAVEEARARLEADSMLALAEVVRARGLAAAADTVIASLGSADAYLRYLWIQSVDGEGADVIYVPTEAGLPILEAGRLAPAPVPNP